MDGEEQPKQQLVTITFRVEGTAEKAGKLVEDLQFEARPGVETVAYDIYPDRGQFSQPVMFGQN